MEINYKGREDGLGNRLTEVAFLEYIAAKNNIKINYIWTNSLNRFDRRYPILIQSKNVQISQDPKLEPNFEKYFKKGPYIKEMNKEDWANCANLIKPNFSFVESNEEIVSVHLRGGDRIIRFNKHFIKNYKTKKNSHFLNTNLEYKYLQKKSIDYLNSTEPKNLFICSDSETVKNNYQRKIKFKHSSRQQIFETKVSDVYFDFFNLAFSTKIVMVSKFSSFAIMASLVGKTKLMVYRGTPFEDRFSKYVEYY
jgi:hypothetical protein